MLLLNFVVYLVWWLFTRCCRQIAVDELLQPLNIVRLVSIQQ